MNRKLIFQCIKDAGDPKANVVGHRTADGEPHHSHRQAIRNATCEVHLQHQGNKLVQFRCALHVTKFCELSTDEARPPLQFECRESPEFLLMLHARAGSQSKMAPPLQMEEVIATPAVIAVKSTKCIGAVVKQRVGHVWQTNAESSPADILNSDSAKAMKQLAKHDRSQPTPRHWFVHSFCAMHVVATAVVNAFDVFGYVCEMFCATRVIHRGSHRRLT